MRKVTVLVMVSILFFSSSAVFAVDTLPANMASCAWFYGSSKDYHYGDIFGSVNLTAQQRERMRDLMRSVRTEQHHVNYTDMEAMHKVITAGEFDQPAVQALFEKIFQQQVKRHVEMARIRNQMFSMLTPEQKTLLNQINKQYISGMQWSPVEKVTILK